MGETPNYQPNISGYLMGKAVCIHCAINFPVTFPPGFKEHSIEKYLIQKLSRGSDSK